MSSPAIETQVAPSRRRSRSCPSARRSARRQSTRSWTTTPSPFRCLGICSALAVTIQLNRASSWRPRSIAVLVACSSNDHLAHPELHSAEHPHHRAAVGHRLAGHRGRPGAAGLPLRHQQAAVGVRRPHHHELHRDGPRRGLRHGQPAVAVVPRRPRQRARLRRHPDCGGVLPRAARFWAACSASNVVPSVPCTTSATSTTD